MITQHERCPPWVTALVMMHDGKIIFDVEGEEKKKLTVSDLLEKFKLQVW